MTRIIYGTEDGQFYADKVTDADTDLFWGWRPIEISDDLFAMWEEARTAYLRATQVFQRACYRACDAQYPEILGSEPVKPAVPAPTQFAREADPELERLLTEEP